MLDSTAGGETWTESDVSSVHISAAAFETCVSLCTAWEITFPPVELKSTVFKCNILQDPICRLFCGCVVQSDLREEIWIRTDISMTLSLFVIHHSVCVCL